MSLTLYHLDAPSDPMVVTFSFGIKTGGKTEIVRENFPNSRLGRSDDILLAYIQLFLCQCSQRRGKQWALFSLSLGTKCENVL